MDSAALEIAATTQTAFGQVRLGGSLGFMSISVFVGWLLTRFDLMGLLWGARTLPRQSQTVSVVGER